MASNVEIRLSQLTYRRAAELLERSPDELHLTLVVDSWRPTATLPLALVLVSVSRQARERLTVKIEAEPEDGASAAAAGLLLQLDGSERGHDLSVPEPWTGAGALVAPTSAFSCRTLQTFRKDLLRLLRSAEIPLTRKSSGALSRIGLEATSNAEEHGYLMEDERPVSLRFMTVEHLRDPRQPWGRQRFVPAAEKYLASYLKAQEPPEGGWIQVVVADAGPGAPFPRYRVAAEKAGWPSDRWNVYDSTVEDELVTLGVLLNKLGTTKGQWGRILNRATPPGQGANELKLSLGLAQGHATLRTGRSLAHWDFSEPNLEQYVNKPLGPYEVEAISERPLLGTVWWVIFPNTAQPELPIDVR